MVPITQPRYCSGADHTTTWGSNLPSPWWARAKDASTTSIPASARRRAEPGSEGAKPIPVGTKRALASSPAPAARPTPPPPVSTVSAPNWAPPDHTTADITIAGRAPRTGAASTPKVTPSAAVGSASVAEARTAWVLVEDTGPPPPRAYLMVLGVQNH